MPWTRYYAVGCKSAFNQHDKRKDQKCSIRSVQGKDIRKNCPGGGWKLCKNVKQENLPQATGKFICCWSLCCCKLFWIQGKSSLSSLLGCLYHIEMLLNPSTEQKTCSSQQAKLWKLGQKTLTHFPSRKNMFQNDLSCPHLSPAASALQHLALSRKQSVKKKSLARAKQCGFCTWDSLVFHTSNKAFYFTLKQEHHFPNWEAHPAACTNTAGIKFIKQGVHGAATWSVTELSTQPEVTALNFLC